MAKRAHKPEGKTPVLPKSADTEVCPPVAAPAIDTPSAAAAFTATDETAPAEVLGVSPPQAPSSDSVTVEQSDSATVQQSDSADPLTNGPTEPPPPNPAIELAKKHRVAAGKPRDGHPRYRTPPPYDIFAARAAKQGRKP